MYLGYIYAHCTRGENAAYVVETIDPAKLEPVSIDGVEYSAADCIHAANYGLSPLYSKLQES
jgi:hypothetical protein